MFLEKNVGIGAVGFFSFLMMREILPTPLFWMVFLRVDCFVLSFFLSTPFVLFLVLSKLMIWDRDLLLLQKGVFIRIDFILRSGSVGSCSFFFDTPQGLVSSGGRGAGADGAVDGTLPRLSF